MDGIHKNKMNTPKANTGELLMKVSPTLKLKDLKIGDNYLLPADFGDEIKHMLIEINKKTGICHLKSRITPSKNKEKKINYEFWRVHYSWIRNLNHIPQYIKHD